MNTNQIREVVAGILRREQNICRIAENDRRVSEMFEPSINEADETLRADVLSKLSSGEWEKPNPQSFSNALNKSKHKDMLTNYSVSELSGMKLFKLSGYDIGFALKKWEDGSFKEIVAVFNNEPEVKNIGRELIGAAIKNGGCYLDHFDGFLSSLYSGMGFEEIKRDKFDKQYDPDGSFSSKYGEADVIYRKHKGCK